MSIYDNQLKIPMNLYRNRFRALGAPTNNHIIDQRIGHLAVQVLDVHILLDQRTAVISDSDSLIKLLYLLFTVLDHTLQPITLSRKSFDITR